MSDEETTVSDDDLLAELDRPVESFDDEDGFDDNCDDFLPEDLGLLDEESA